LYIGTEWHGCRPSPLVLELWQRQERLDQNMAWIQRIFWAFIFFWCRMISRRSSHFSRIQVSIFYCLACIKMRLHEKSSYFLGYNAWKSADVSEKRVEEYAMHPLLASCFVMVSRLAYSLALKMICSSEIYVDV
jgi:hypothetical protein